MLCINGSPLYQWDRNRQLKIDAVDIHSKFEIHCGHAKDTTTLIVEPIIEGDTILANIPNILLQREGFLRVYVVVSGDTIYDQSFYVIARAKPDDYVYTETEVKSYEALDKRITALEEGGSGSGGGTSFKVDETLSLKDGVLGVNTADTVEADNTLPITSAAVFVTVGNIEALLNTI